MREQPAGPCKRNTLLTFGMFHASGLTVTFVVLGWRGALGYLAGAFISVTAGVFSTLAAAALAISLVAASAPQADACDSRSIGACGVISSREQEASAYCRGRLELGLKRAHVTPRRLSARCAFAHSRASAAMGFHSIGRHVPSDCARQLRRWGAQRLKQAEEAQHLKQAGEAQHLKLKAGGEAKQAAFRADCRAKPPTSRESRAAKVMAYLSGLSLILFFMCWWDLWRGQLSRLPRACLRV
jgi:hypothetical protein